MEEAIDVVIADISKNGVTADELDRAKNRIIADMVYAGATSRVRPSSNCGRRAPRRS
jgi:hypothetical protein